MLVHFNGELAEVDDDLFGIVHEIRFRYPNLYVQFADPSRCGIQDPPYRIVERTAQGDVQVLAVWSLDRRTLDQLELMNSHNVDIQKLIEETNAKVKKEKEYKVEQDNLEGADVVASMIKHFNKGRIEFKYDNGNEKRIVREDGNFAKKSGVI